MMSALDAPTSRQCRLSLLGSFALDTGRQALATRESGARVLAYLAVHGKHRPVSRTTLAERLNPGDGDAGRCAARLRTVLWRMPRADGRSLVTTTATSVTLADFIDVDLWRAETIARRLRTETELDAGTVESAGFADDLLPDWADDWLVLERESYRQTRLHALERASAALCRNGSHEAALQAALTAVACEPLRETAHRRVIEAHMAEGNNAEALRQYQTYRRLLRAELGLAPTAAIRAVVAPLLGRPLDAAGSPKEPR